MGTIRDSELVFSLFLKILNFTKYTYSPPGFFGNIVDQDPFNAPLFRFTW